MAFSIQQVWQVNAPHLKSVLTLNNDNVQQITTPDGGSMLFVKLAKGDLSTQRLLLGRAPGKNDPGLAHTDIIEQIKAARDLARKELMQKTTDEQQASQEQLHARKMEGKIDISIDGGGNPDSLPTMSAKGKPPTHTVSDQFVTVNTPDLPSVPSVRMDVLIDQNAKKTGSHAIWVRLSADAVSYLHAAAMEQLKADSIHNVHPRSEKPPVGVPGLSRVYSGKRKGQYRLSGPRASKTKFFSAADDADAKMRAQSSLGRTSDGSAEPVDDDANSGNEEAVTDDGE